MRWRTTAVEEMWWNVGGREATMVLAKQQMSGGKGG